MYSTPYSTILGFILVPMKLQGVCLIVDIEFPELFTVYPDSPSTFFYFFPSIHPLTNRTFWNLAKFWYFLQNLLFSKKLSPTTLDFLSKFLDFFLTFPWISCLTCLGKHPVIILTDCFLIHLNHYQSSTYVKCE